MRPAATQNHVTSEPGLLPRAMSGSLSASVTHACTKGHRIPSVVMQVSEGHATQGPYQSEWSVLPPSVMVMSGTELQLRPMSGSYCSQGLS